MMSNEKRNLVARYISGCVYTHHTLCNQIQETGCFFNELFYIISTHILGR